MFDKYEGQPAYQVVHQSVSEAISAYYDVIKTNGSYGHQLQYAKGELDVASAHLENALQYAIGAERIQLEQYQQYLQSMVTNVSRYEEKADTYIL